MGVLVPFVQIVLVTYFIVCKHIYIFRIVVHVLCTLIYAIFVLIGQYLQCILVWCEQLSSEYINQVYTNIQGTRHNYDKLELGLYTSFEIPFLIYQRQWSNYFKLLRSKWSCVLIFFRVGGLLFAPYPPWRSYTRSACVGLPTNQSTHLTSRRPTQAVERSSTNASAAFRIPLPYLTTEVHLGVTRATFGQLAIAPLTTLHSKSRNTDPPQTTLISPITIDYILVLIFAYSNFAPYILIGTLWGIA